MTSLDIYRLGVGSGLTLGTIAATILLIWIKRAR